MKQESIQKITQNFMKHNYQFCAVPYKAMVALSTAKNQSAFVVYAQLLLNSVDNKVMISRKTLSELTGYNSNYITEITKKLESMGLIRKEKHFNNASAYYIITEPLKSQETDEADSCIQETGVSDSCTLELEDKRQITRDRLQETDEADSNIEYRYLDNTILSNSHIEQNSTNENIVKSIKKEYLNRFNDYIEQNSTMGREEFDEYRNGWFLNMMKDLNEYLTDEEFDNIVNKVNVYTENLFIQRCISA